MTETETAQETSRLRSVAPMALAGLFAGSGVLHLVTPQPFVAIVPRRLPAQEALVYASGVLELVCAAGLARRKAWAGPASALLLAAVFPANVQMALDSGSGRLPGVADNPVVAWGRLPLQAPMIWAALQVRRPRRRQPRP